MVAISLRGPGMVGSVADSVKRSTRTRPRGGEGGVEEAAGDAPFGAGEGGGG